MTWILLLLGIVLLYLGGEVLVRAASALAKNVGMSPLVIGLTVVAFGTSAPELAATLMSALNGNPEVAIGNVLGSNIANIGLILGITGVIFPLQGQKGFVRREISLMIVVLALCLPLMFDGQVSRLEGALLFSLLLGYLWYQFRQKPGEDLAEQADKTEAPVKTGVGSSLLSLVSCAVGILLLVFGARLLVDSAVSIATSFGLSERVIGLTIVALGTSLPELASSIVAALRRETELILGGIVGSNIFNVLAILGLSSLVSPIPFDFSAIRLDIALMLVLGLALIPSLLPDLRLQRREGLLFLSVYLGYSVALYVFQ